jgi:hypothetical protein
VIFPPSAHENTRGVIAYTYTFPCIGIVHRIGHKARALRKIRNIYDYTFYIEPSDRTSVPDVRYPDRGEESNIQEISSRTKSQTDRESVVFEKPRVGRREQRREGKKQRS